MDIVAFIADVVEFINEVMIVLLDGAVENEVIEDTGGDEKEEEEEKVVVVILDADEDGE